jgi:hypothetical protein
MVYRPAPHTSVSVRLDVTDRLNLRHRYIYLSLSSEHF